MQQVRGWISCWGVVLKELSWLLDGERVVSLDVGSWIRMTLCFYGMSTFDSWTMIIYTSSPGTAHGISSLDSDQCSTPLNAGHIWTYHVYFRRSSILGDRVLQHTSARSGQHSPSIVKHRQGLTPYLGNSHTFATPSPWIATVLAPENRYGILNTSLGGLLRSLISKYRPRATSILRSRGIPGQDLGLVFVTQALVRLPGLTTIFWFGIQNATTCWGVLLDCFCNMVEVSNISSGKEGTYQRHLLRAHEHVRASQRIFPAKTETMIAKASVKQDYR